MTANAIIVAAGRGTRMGDLTETHPKCLTPLAGKTLLEWQINALREGGIETIAIVGGYKKELLEAYGDLHFVNEDWSTSNMVASIRAASILFERGPVIVSYSDIVYNHRAVSLLRAAEGDIVITADRLWLNLWQERFIRPLDDAERFRVDNGRIVEIGGKANSCNEIMGQFIGLNKISPHGWKKLEDVLNAEISGEAREKVDFTTFINLGILHGLTVMPAWIDGWWCEIDSQKDLQICKQELKNAELRNDRWHHDWRD